MFAFLWRPWTAMVTRKRSCVNRVRPRFESLEERCLLSASIADYTIPTSQSSPYAITAGPTGEVWFTELGANKIGTFNPTTHAMVEYPIPTTHCIPTSITVGPDGNVWFTEMNATQIGMLNVSTGVITEYQTPTAGSVPYGITAGPDGNIWFTERSANQIGEFNLSTRTITEYVISTTIATAPTSITAGSDGNLWFTESSSDQIGMINPTSHVISAYTIPSGNDATAITSGPSGNLWFVELAGNRVGDLNPVSKGMSEFAIPTSNSGAQSIAVGPDGNLWFIEVNTNMIGTFTPATLAFGAVAIPSGGTEPGAITASPTGALFFTETNDQQVGNLIGEIVAPPTITTAPGNQTVLAGQSATFSAAAINGLPTPTVYWQVSTNGGASFTPLSNGGVYSGAKTGKLIISSPTTAMSGYEFEAVFSNGSGSVTTAPVTLTVHSLLSVPALPQGVIGSKYNHTVAVTGSTSPIQLLTATDFNAGGTGLTAADVSINVKSGTITVSGTPTAAGTATFTISVENTAGASTTQAMTITIRPPLSIGTPSLPQADAGTSYAQAISILGGALPYATFSVSNFNAGTTGLTASAITPLAATGAFQVNGTARAAGSATFTIQVIDATGASVTKSYTLAVNAALAITSTLPQGTAASNYHQVVSATGGGTAYTSVAVSYFSAGTTGMNIGDITTSAGAGTCTINGTPAAAGTFSFTVNVVDAIGTLLSKTYTVTIGPPPAGTPIPKSPSTNPTLVITPTWPAGTTGTNYRQVLTASGGTAPYASITVSAFNAGTTGLNISDITTSAAAGTCTINGTPASTGTLTLTVNVVDAKGAFLSKAYTVHVNPALTITPALLPQGTAGASYHQVIMVANGTMPYTTFTISSFSAGGSGLTASAIVANSATGTITVNGAPTATGTLSFTVNVTDSAHSSLSKTYSVAVNPAPTIGSPSVTQWTQGTFGFPATLAIAGGSAPFTITSYSGLPTGLIPVVAGSAIGFAGTPSAAQSFANGSVTIQDAAGASVTKTFGMTINPPPAISGLTATQWTVGQAGFTGGMTVGGGTGGLGIASSSGVPTGLSLMLSGSTLRFTGTPTAPGTFAGSVTLHDTIGVTITQSFTFVINAVPALSSPSTTQWTAGKAGFPAVMTISGGTGPFQITKQTGLPTGVTATVSGSAVKFAGTPTAPGAYAGSVTVLDAAGATATQSFQITINPPLLITTTLAAPSMGILYASTVVATGGTGIVTFAVTAGSLPPGLKLASNGLITGATRQSGTFTFTITATDAVGATVSKQYVLKITGLF